MSETLLGRRLEREREGRDRFNFFPDLEEAAPASVVDAAASLMRRPEDIEVPRAELMLAKRSRWPRLVRPQGTGQPK